MTLRIVTVALAISGGLISLPAQAEKSVELAAAYTADIGEVVPAEGRSNLYYLDNLDLTATADLEKVLGWTGGTFHAHVLNCLSFGSCGVAV